MEVAFNIARTEWFESLQSGSSLSLLLFLYYSLYFSFLHIHSELKVAPKLYGILHHEPLPIPMIDTWYSFADTLLITDPHIYNVRTSWHWPKNKPWTKHPTALQNRKAALISKTTVYQQLITGFFHSTTVLMSKFELVLQGLCTNFRNR